MEQGFSIWSQVIVAELNSPHWYRGEDSYTVDRFFHVLEDLKIKIRQTEAVPRGQVLEVRIRIEILFLLQGENGKHQLIKKEETIKERVAYSNFTRDIEKDASSLNFIVNIKALPCDGELQGREIRVKYLIEYNLIATREQVVELWSENSAINSKYLNDLLKQLEDEVNRLSTENINLRRQVFIYQKDISSLKRGISKLEESNNELTKDLGYHQREMESLRQILLDKEEQLYHLQRYFATVNENQADKNHEQPEAFGLGSRIKRLFLNNLSN
ncbi:MAG: hypothetical protein ACOX6E_09090 [Syntrophomonadaceae bacterium]